MAPGREGREGVEGILAAMSGVDAIWAMYAWLDGRQKDETNMASDGSATTNMGSTRDLPPLVGKTAG